MIEHLEHQSLGAVVLAPTAKLARNSTLPISDIAKQLYKIARIRTSS
jgi:hypothetical protein